MSLLRALKSHLIVIFQAKLLSVAGTTGLMRLNHPQWLELPPTQDPKRGQVFPLFFGDSLGGRGDSLGPGPDWSSLDDGLGSNAGSALSSCATPGKFAPPSLSGPLVSEMGRR